MVMPCGAETPEELSPVCVASKKSLDSRDDANNFLQIRRL